MGMDTGDASSVTGIITRASPRASVLIAIRPASLAGRLIALRLASIAGLLIALRVDASVLITLCVDAGGLSCAGLAGTTASCVTALSTASLTCSPWHIPDSSAETGRNCS